MKTWMIGIPLIIFLAGCSPKPKVPSDLEAFIQAGHENKISIIKAKEDVPVKFVDQQSPDPVMGWCAAYEVVNEKNELWKFESLFTQVEGKWVDVGAYNKGLAVFPPGIIMDHRWCDY
ncbi:MAG: hypothetical protein C0391_08075 [Anaerolinea sp.]|nr:hypothetical protein [Anaerolinea sp.]